MSNLAEQPKNKVVAVAKRALATVANAKKEAKAAALTGVNLGVAYGVGAAIGYSRRRWGTGSKKSIMVPGTKMPADLAGGLAVGAGCLLGAFDDLTPIVANVAGATLAANGAIDQVLAD
jgi:hypothetical protein